MKISVTLHFEISDDNLSELLEAGREAGERQFTDRAEWDEYRASTALRTPEETDLVEILMDRLWSASDQIALTFIELLDTDTVTIAEDK